MLDRVKRKWNNFRARKKELDDQALSDLKFRYHAFRILLANNDRSLDLINEFETSIKHLDLKGQKIAGLIEELLHVTYEMVDGLNQLDGYTSQGLYNLHRRLATEIWELLDHEPQAANHPLVLSLSDIGLEHAHLVGGKAASLGRLTANGLPVPKGFVLTLAASHLFFENNQLESNIFKYLDELKMQADFEANISTTANAIRTLIIEAEIPPELDNALNDAYQGSGNSVLKSMAVRSSATVEDKLEHSFAGQFTTVLNVTSLEACHRAYKEVLASNFNARSLSYRLQNRLSWADFGMAVLFQEMVHASAAGVMYTVDPTDRRFSRSLISAVPALGTLAVDGGAPADLYYLSRNNPDAEPEMKIAEKTLREKAALHGGLVIESVPENERLLPLLTPQTVRKLIGLGLTIEYLNLTPQDVEWAIDDHGNIFILQARPLQLPGGGPTHSEAKSARELLSGAVTSSPGSALGQVRIIESTKDLEQKRYDNAILILAQSLVEAVRILPESRGVIVELGNPGDHLSNVAREYGRPMITGATGARNIFSNEQWIVLDADRGRVLEAPVAAVDNLRNLIASAVDSVPAKKVKNVLSDETARLKDLIAPLNLTNAYGSTFSIRECQTIHDLIRYVHEAALMAMFSLADDLVEDHFSEVHWLDEGLPFHFFIIDLGGGLKSGDHPTRLRLDDVVSFPFQALWTGMTTPGLRWHAPPPSTNISGVFTKTLSEKSGVRALGSSNYAMISRDYLNLNTRLDFHFAMIDTVCGFNARENYIRFRFKGGGTSQAQRERRVRFIAEILKPEGFFINLRGDLITASLIGVRRDMVEDKLVLLGRLLGFTRLLDASMVDDQAFNSMIQAFSEGDWGLARFQA